MTTAALPRTGRETALVALLLGLAAAAWALTYDRMEAMDAGAATDLGDLGWFAVSWALMMAAMMLPALTPMVAFARPAPNEMDAPNSATSSAICLASRVFVPSRISAAVASDRPGMSPSRAFPDGTWICIEMFGMRWLSRLPHPSARAKLAACQHDKRI